MRSQLLDHGWTLRVDGATDISATAPGSVHGALMAAGLLADPYVDLNELRQDWVSRRDWTYRCTFDWAGEGIADLVFEGIDTFASITLNGVPLGDVANMHRSHRFRVTDLLRDGANELEVAIRSAYTVGEELAREIEPRPNNYPGPANLMRKMASSFGWDWGPTLAGAGIWRPVRIDSWQRARLMSVRPLVTLAGSRGTSRVMAEIESGDGAGPLTLRQRLAGHVVEVPVDNTGHCECVVDVNEPRVWWPYDLGDPALYDLEVELCGADGEVLDRWTRRIGFRSVRLDTEPDAVGTPFRIIVNDVPVYVKGANWIPDDILIEHVTPERYRSRVVQAVGANINLLRVWGGGLYESEAFYQACDELGVMIWQDFLFACAAYPEEGALPGEIEAEARENVIRLMPHASLILWNGNNENIWMWADAGWRTVLGERTWGLGYYLALLPRVVADLDPTRPYWPGSPYSGRMDIAPNDPAHGCTHIWNVWNEVGYEAYREIVPRFCSEFGWQAPPVYATIAQSISERPLTLNSVGIAHHQKATDGAGKLLRGLDGHLPRPCDLDGWIYLTQLNQARAVTTAIEHMRSHRGTNMGAIVWQLNDCWPVVSWSAVDGYGRLKPLWYAMRRSFASHLLTIQPREGGLHVFAVNDRTLFWRSSVVVRRISFEGTVLAEWRYWRLGVDRLDIGGLRLPESITRPDDPAGEMIVATMLDSVARWYFREDIELKLRPAEFDVQVTTRGEDETVVLVTARTFLRSLCLFADRLGPEAGTDDMLVDLLPGESHRFRVTGLDRHVTRADILAPGVIQCVNDYVPIRSRGNQDG